jgi:hypothetical protein
VTGVQGANWPAWRGPTGQGVSSETGLPTAGSRNENVRWNVPLPAPGDSTPTIWGDCVFIPQANDVTLKMRTHKHLWSIGDAE